MALQAINDAKKYVQNTTTKAVIVKSIEEILQKVVASMCSNKFNSILIKGIYGELGTHISLSLKLLEN